jgi:hypothetical protein
MVLRRSRDELSSPISIMMTSHYLYRPFFVSLAIRRRANDGEMMGACGVQECASRVTPKASKVKGFDDS